MIPHVLLWLWTAPPGAHADDTLPSVAQTSSGPLTTDTDTASSEQDSTDTASSEQDSTQEQDATSADSEDGTEEDTSSQDETASTAMESTYVAHSPLIPDPPALTIIDQAGTTLDEPSSPSDFAISAGSFFNEDGQVQAGGAAEIGLRAIGLTRWMTAEHYRAHRLARVLARTYASAATTADDSDVLAAAGFRSVLFTTADSLLAEDYDQAVAQARTSCAQWRESEGTAYPDCIKREYPKNMASYTPPPWNSSGLVLSAAWSWRFVDGSTARSTARTAGTWLSGTVALGEDGQAGAALGWTHSLTEDPDELSIAGLLRMGVGRTRLALESAYIAQPRSDAESATIPLAISGEFQVEEDLWIQSTIGLEFSPGDDLVTIISRATFHWGQDSEPSFKTETIDES